MSSSSRGLVSYLDRATGQVVAAGYHRRRPLRWQDLQGGDCPHGSASTILHAAAGTRVRIVDARQPHQSWSTPTHAEPATYRCVLRIAAEHPALPGHFPGRPIVPGVVLLDCVLNEADAWLGSTVHVTGLRQAKFTSMLLPEQAAELELQLLAGELRFVIARASQPIAQGAFTLAPGSAAGRSVA
jgi:3-hydroxyacyl-[acyl-carrier-protein] dehydratase